MINVTGLADKKILLVDDEEEILNLLEMVLKKEGFKAIFRATTGEDALEKCYELTPDVVVLDIMLPDLSGLDVCKKIRETMYVPIIFLSAKSDDIDKLLGLGMGGDDYVTKPFSPKEVAFRVIAQLRRNEYLNHGDQKASEKEITFGDVKINPSTGEVYKANQSITLRAKEYQLLQYLAEHPNQILSKKQICDYVWGEDYFGYDNTIMVHIRHLREKLEDDPSNPKFIQTIKGLGYKLAIKGT